MSKNHFSNRAESELEKFQLLDKNAKFSYLIGTNKRETPDERPLLSTSSCCQAIKRRLKKLRLYCPDGKSFVTEIEIIKKCARLQNS